MTMIVDNLDALAGVLEGMDVGHRFDLPRAGFRTLWPRPDMPLKDDYLSDRERAERWCDHFGCTVWERHDPPGLSFEKVRLQEPQFVGFRPGPPPVDEVSRETMMEFFRR